MHFPIQLDCHLRAASRRSARLFIGVRPEARRAALGCRAVALGLCFAAAARAELDWLQRRLLLEPPAGAKEAAGIFQFVNRGEKPVRVVNVRADCGCTVMAGEAEVVPPGGKGSVRAVFHVGSRTGKQSVAVTVTAEEPETRVYNLMLDVAIKDFVTVTPSFVYWKLGDSTEPKVLQVALAPGFQFLSAECATSDFLVEKAVAGPVVQLRVIPRDTWAKRNGTIKINVREGEQSPIEVLAYARVM